MGVSNVTSRHIFSIGRADLSGMIPWKIVLVGRSFFSESGGYNVALVWLLLFYFPCQGLPTPPYNGGRGRVTNRARLRYELVFVFVGEVSGSSPLRGRVVPTHMMSHVLPL